MIVVDSISAGPGGYKKRRFQDEARRVAGGRHTGLGPGTQHRAISWLDEIAQLGAS